MKELIAREFFWIVWRDGSPVTLGTRYRYNDGTVNWGLVGIDYMSDRDVNEEAKIVPVKDTPPTLENKHE